MEFELVKKYPFPPLFSERLSSENGWDEAYTAEVIMEYRRFLYLMIKNNFPLTPSDPVDMAWHLHITHTKHYARFCAYVGRWLHHDPTEGGISEEEKFLEQYKTTLRLYVSFFHQEPPSHIWQDEYTRFSVPANSWVRVNLLKNGVYKKYWSVPYFILGFLSIVILGFNDFFFNNIAAYAYPCYFALLIFNYYYPERTFNNRIDKIERYNPSLDAVGGNNCGGGGCGGGG